MGEKRVRMETAGRKRVEERVNPGGSRGAGSVRAGAPCASGLSLSEMRSLDRRLPAGSWHGACLSTLLSEVLLEGKEKKNDPSSYSKSWGS